MSVAYKKNGTEIPITSAIMGGKISGEYTTQGLTLASGTTIHAGGYCKIGNLVIGNFRLTNGGALILSGLPTYDADANIVQVLNTKSNTIIWVTPEGELRTDSNNGVLQIVNFVYVSNQ